MAQEKEVILAYVDAFNRGDVDAVCSLFAADAEVWGVLGWGTIEQARPVWKDLMECLQVHLRVDGIAVDGGTVVARYTERGTSVKAFRGMGPTGKSYEILAMEWFEVRDGKIERRWGARDSGSQNR